MKAFRMIGMALVAMVLSFSVSSCSDDDDNFIPVEFGRYLELACNPDLLVL